MMLSGKTALVTGASRGLGQAIAVELAGAGARVALFARSADGLQHTRASIEAAGGEALLINGDVTSDADVARAEESIRNWAGRLDILVNNAGVLEPLGGFAGLDFSHWAESLSINVVGTARITSAMLSMLRADGGGTIVTISSGAAVGSVPGWSAYCTSKAALDRFAMVLDVELKDDGVRSFSFAPGTIDTHMQRAIQVSGVGPQRLVRGEVEHFPPEVPAKAVAFLCTPAAVELAGQHIDIRYPEVRATLGVVGHEDPKDLIANSALCSS